MHASKHYWTVNGKFKGQIPVGNRKITKHNDLIYKSILGGRLIGFGQAKLELYHAMLNLPSPCTSSVFTAAQRDILIAAQYVANNSMDNATKELSLMHSTDQTEDLLKTIVSFDGSYQQRPGKSGGGFSRYCFGAAISVETAKVLSYDVACNSCSHCTRHENLFRSKAITEVQIQEWKLTHEPNCSAKYSDYASVQLESALAPSIVQQALQRGIVFSGIVMDGDNKTHEALHIVNPYHHLGIDEIQRFECLSHVCKRLKINLCNRRDKVMKAKKSGKAVEKPKLSKSVSSKNRLNRQFDESLPRDDWKVCPSHAIQHLTDVITCQICSYFGLVIKRNSGNIPAIIDAVNAIPLHLSANDENADFHHRFCSKDSDTWCRYQSAISQGLPTPHHTYFLGEDAVKIVHDVFDEFGYNTAAFLEKVQAGYTSNHNEALHKILWGMVPKNEQASYEMVQLGSALAVIRYNDGYCGIRHLCDTLGLPFSQHLSDHLQELDNNRILNSKHIAYKQIMRSEKKQRCGKKISKQVKIFGQSYASGEYSAAQSHLNTSDIGEVFDSEDVSEYQVSDMTQPTTTDQAACYLCGGTEEDYALGIRVGTNLQSEEINWIQCSLCGSWFHMECVNIMKGDIEDDDDWFCSNCVWHNSASTLVVVALRKSST